jgi:hypothetical protein
LDVNITFASQLFLLLFVANIVVISMTWTKAKRKVDSPRLLTACNAILGFFPPLNILVLARLAMIDDRKE